ncbi:MAG: ABC transporter ATP-binding protein [Rhodovibrionaceae bacterium]
MPILEVQSLTRRFGGLTAVDGLSFAVEEGEIRGLIGPNGAGKTTTFNVISGFYPPSGGSVVYDGRNISGMKTSVIARLGLVRTFQGTTLFHEMTCRENALIGCHLQAESPFIARVLGSDRTVQRKAEEKAMECLAFFGLDPLAEELAMNLPHGLQRALGMAVALAADPKVLLLDEPFTGMNPEETRHMMGLIEKVRDKGVTLLLVEHDMQAVMGLCNRITVMNFGSLLAEGSPQDIQNNPEVIKAYLGGVEGAETDAA